MNTSNKKMPSGRHNPLNDYLFYRVMGQKGDEFQLLGFLNAVLGRSGKQQLKSVEILENKSFSRETDSGKACILDVLAVLQDGTKVNVEVQLRNEYNMDRRSLFYWGKVYTLSLEKGQDYKDLPDVIAINIVDFDFPPGGGYHTCFPLREDSDPTLILSALEIHFISMVKWRRLEGKDVRNDPLHRWLAMLDKNSSPELVEEVVSMDPAIRAMYDKCEEAMQDHEMYRAYWAERKYEHDMISMQNGIRREATAQGMAEGMAQGLEQGREQGAIEIARNALAKGVSVEFVHEITGLDIDAIKNIQAEM
jgi:predicted transposase/invertase (TIGR01784 family)